MRGLLIPKAAACVVLAAVDAWWTPALLRYPAYYLPVFHPAVPGGPGAWLHTYILTTRAEVFRHMVATWSPPHLGIVVLQVPFLYGVARILFWRPRQAGELRVAREATHGSARWRTRAELRTTLALIDTEGGNRGAR